GAALVAHHVEHPDVPTGEWVDVPARGTYERNPVRFRAEVENPDTVPHVVEVEVRDPDTGERIEGMWWVGALNPGESAEVTFDWDTTGAAWTGEGAPSPPHRFELVVSADGEEEDVQPLEVAVLPEPLVLVHGFNADASTW